VLNVNGDKKKSWSAMELGSVPENQISMGEQRPQQERRRCEQCNIGNYAMYWHRTKISPSRKSATEFDH
jgi:hypothetical protein